MEIDQDSAHVRVPPPFIFLAFVLMGVGFNILYPVHLVTGFIRWCLTLVLFGSAIAVVSYCFWAFKKIETNIAPWKTTTGLVTSGVYRFSRNPIYLSFVLLGLAIAFGLNNAWILLMLTPFIWVINRFVIAKEEKYLENKFGDEYEQYKKKVRRWI